MPNSVEERLRARVGVRHEVHHQPPARVEPAETFQGLLYGSGVVPVVVHDEHAARLSHDLAPTPAAR